MSRNPRRGAQVSPLPPGLSGTPNEGLLHSRINPERFNHVCGSWRRIATQNCFVHAPSLQSLPSPMPCHSMKRPDRSLMRFGSTCARRDSHKVTFTCDLRLGFLIVPVPEPQWPNNGVCSSRCTTCRRGTGKACTKLQQGTGLGGLCCNIVVDETHISLGAVPNGKSMAH